MARTMRYIGMGAAAILMASAALMFGAVAALHSERGARFTEHKISELSEGQVVLRGLRVHGLTEIAFDEFKLQAAGADDADIELHTTALAFRIFPLFARRLVVDALSIEMLIVRSNEMPAQPEKAAPEQAVATLPALPLSIDIGALSIAVLKFEAPAYGLEGQYTVEGRAMLGRRLDEADISIAMQRADRPGALNAVLQFGGGASSPTVQVDFTDEDGAPLAALTGYDSGAITLHVKGHQTGDVFAVDLNGDLAKGPALAGQLGFSSPESRVWGRLQFDLARLENAGIDAYVGRVPVLNFTAQPGGADGIAFAFNTHLQGTQSEAAIEATLILPRGRLFLTNAMQWNISASGAFGAGLDTAQQPFVLSAHGGVQEDGVVDIAALQVSSGAARVSLSGVVPVSEPYSARLKGAIDVADVKELVPDIEGRAKLTFSAQPTVGKNLQVETAGLAALKLSDTQSIDLSLHGTAALDKSGTGQVTLDLTTGPLKNFLPGAEGTLRLTAKLHGPLNALNAAVQVAAPKLIYGRVQMDRAEIAVQTLRPITNLNDVRAAASLVVVSGAAEARLATMLGWNGAVLEAQDISIHLPGVVGAGAMRVSVETGLPAGEITVQARNLAQFAKWPGLAETQPMLWGLAGRGDVAITAAGGKILVKGGLQDLSVPEVGLALATTKLTLDTGMREFISAMNVQLEAEGIEAASLRASALRANVVSGENGYDFALETTVSDPVSMRLQGTGTARFEEEARVELSRLEGDLEGQAFALSDPVRFTALQGEIELSLARFIMGQGYVELSYAQSQKELLGYLDMGGIELAPLLGSIYGIDLPLVLSGRADIGGSLSAPDFAFKAQARAALPDFEEPLHTELSGKSVVGGLAVQGRVSGLEEGVALTATAQVPLDLNFVSGQFGLDQQGDMVVSANGALPLAPFAYLLFEDGSTLGGRIELQASATGSMHAPTFAGQMCLLGGRAGIVASGTTVREGAGCIALQKNGSFEGAVRARDGYEGQAAINVTGSLLNPNIAGNVALTNLRILDGDIGQMIIESAIDFDVALAEAAWPGYVRGSLTVLSADLPIPENSEQDVPVLNVVHVNRLGMENEAPFLKDADAPNGTDLKLDMAVKVPGRFFLRGRGIESEWKGDVGVKGTFAAPIVSGDIGLVKGVASTGAATLKFTEGTVQILPAKPGTLPKIFVNMVSESRVSGVLVRLQVMGPVRQPQIKFSSEPALPEDEILARLLFGKPAAQLTTSEALSLSAAALELTGAFGGSAGIMDKVRRGLGVDRLSVDASSDAPEQSSLSAGKYLTPDLYLSVRQGADGTNPDVRVEYQLNDKISVTGDQKGEGGEAVGIEYRLDY